MSSATSPVFSSLAESNSSHADTSRRPDSSDAAETDNNGPAPTKRRRARRDMRACVSCRKSKVRCDGNKPCQRCARSRAECLYPHVIKDPTTERIEKLEAEVRMLKAGGYQSFPKPPVAGASPGSVHCPTDASSSVAGQIAPSVLSPATADLQAVEGRLGSVPTPILAAQYVVSPPSARFSQTESPSYREPGFSVDAVVSRSKWRAFQHRNLETRNAVRRGIVDESQAVFWFKSFFSGSHYLVPVFCLKYDTYTSVAARSAFLFDAIITIGCRIEEGPSSPNYQKLQGLIRQHLSSSILTPSVTASQSLETIQALMVIGSYADNGWLLISLALRIALQNDLLDSVDSLLTKIADRKRRNEDAVDEEERLLFRISRIWFGAFNLEHIFSLDGEIPPGITFTSAPQRLRALLSHPERTPIDLRLLSQVELNIIRANSHTALLRCWDSPSVFVDLDAEIGAIVRDSRIDLDLWYEEWTGIVRKYNHEYSSSKESSLALLQLKIQHTWALITLHLKAVSNTGIENIAEMTDFQRNIVNIAKEEAIRHLQLLLQASSSPPTPDPSPLRDGTHPADTDPTTPHRSAYLQSFKWTMDFVWAKCAFSILLVLRLAMLLRDPPERLMDLLRDSHQVLEELKNFSVGHAAYFQILQSSVEKCETALLEWIGIQHGAASSSHGAGAGLEYIGTNAAVPAGTSKTANPQMAETEFEGYAPKEFLSDWNFPGLNLRHVPLGWQDFFLDFETFC